MRQEASPRDIIFLARYTLHLLEVDQAYEKFDEYKKHLHKKQTTHYILTEKTENLRNIQYPPWDYHSKLLPIYRLGNISLYSYFILTKFISIPDIHSYINQYYYIG